MTKRRYFWWGLWGSLAVLSLFAIVIVVEIAFSYEGRCGGLMPFLSGPKPCPFWQYMFEGVFLSGVILLGVFWPLVLALLVVPTLVGYLVDRRVQKRDRPASPP